MIEHIKARLPRAFVIAGNVAQGARLSLDPYDLIVGRRIAGSWGGDPAPMNPDADMRYWSLCTSTAPPVGRATVSMR